MMIKTYTHSAYEFCELQNFLIWFVFLLMFKYAVCVCVCACVCVTCCSVWKLMQSYYILYVTLPLSLVIDSGAMHVHILLMHWLSLCSHANVCMCQCVHAYVCVCMCLKEPFMIHGHCSETLEARRGPGASVDSEMADSSGRGDAAVFFFIKYTHTIYTYWMWRQK